MQPSVANGAVVTMKQGKITVRCNVAASHVVVDVIGSLLQRGAVAFTPVPRAPSGPPGDRTQWRRPGQFARPRTRADCR